MSLRNIVSSYVVYLRADHVLKILAAGRPNDTNEHGLLDVSEEDGEHFVAWAAQDSCFHRRVADVVELAVPWFHLQGGADARAIVEELKSITEDLVPGAKH